MLAGEVIVDFHVLVNEMNGLKSIQLSPFSRPLACLVLLGQLLKGQLQPKIKSAISNRP